MYQMVHCSRMDDKRPRDRLLEAAIDYVAEHGISDLSLRRAGRRARHQPPDAHPPLRLQGGPVDRDRPHRRGAPARLARRARCPTPTSRSGEAMRAWWKHISDPSLWPNERLFFELYGQALQGRRAHDRSSSTGSSSAGSSRRREINVVRGFPGARQRLTPAPRHRGHPRTAARPAGHRRRGRRRRRDGRFHRPLRGVGRARGAAGRPGLAIR